MWRRPWRILRGMDRRQLWELVTLGVLLAVMNSVFYLAVARLPLATVGAIEFLGTVVLATLGVRTIRNLIALAVTVGGVALLTAFKVVSDPVGFFLAFANCAAFMVYVLLGHRIANSKAKSAANPDGIDQLAAAMLIAAVIATPIGAADAGPAFTHPVWLLWGAGVGVCSSVVPYVTDQLAMAKMPRATFALMLSLLPACAAIIGVVVLHQIPTIAEVGGIGLVILGLLLHASPISGRSKAEVSSASARRHRNVTRPTVPHQIKPTR